MSVNEFLSSRTNRGNPFLQAMMTQESASYEGSDVKDEFGTGGTTTAEPQVWESIDRAGNPRLSKGIRVDAGCPGGDLVVHLVEDWDGADPETANRVFVTYSIPAVAAGAIPYREGFIFDAIAETGTTLDLDYVKILQ